MAKKIKIDNDLFERLTDCSVLVGYSSVEEFIVHVLEKEADLLEKADDDPDVMARLKGLGYIA